ncbi:hypothetical protein LG329_17970 [Virgibacillus necropolis]|uniref:hypothetical protein n=1 Tax=Virgibacillus necropolis TaxID=163877 RepID=UPI00384B1DC2
MNSRVDHAVLNNVAWCGIVCGTHGIKHTIKGNLWGLHRKAPTFYPEIITVSRNAMSEEVRYFIENGDVSSIKDSYTNLDLLPYGFTILFEAEWIYHASVSIVNSIQSTWRVITTEKDLAEWTSASDLENVIKPNLLKFSDVKIFMNEKNGELSGFIANLSANVVGVSNVFSTSNESVWEDIPGQVSTEFPGVSMVGYEHNNDLKAAQLSGWTSIGPLRVWGKQ